MNGAILFGFMQLTAELAASASRCPMPGLSLAVVLARCQRLGYCRNSLRPCYFWRGSISAPTNQHYRTRPLFPGTLALCFCQKGPANSGRHACSVLSRFVDMHTTGRAVWQSGVR